MRVISIVLVLAACGSSGQAPAPAIRHEPAHAGAAIAAVRAGRFADALREADAALAASPRDAQVAAARAFARYALASSTLIWELGQILDRGESFKAFDHDAGREVWTTFLGELERIDVDLSVVAADRELAFEMCLACCEYDWNRSGELDERDREWLELEYDGNGGRLPDADPRRRPTYRFDVGDALWARAMVSFQRAAVELVLAYRWSELDKLFQGVTRQRISIQLLDGDRVKRARDLVIAGLGFSMQTREAYLAETDDDREWVPSPRQHSYAMPLSVDDKLYATWSGVLADMHRLLSSHDGVRFRDAIGLLVGNDDAQTVPDVFIDVGRMFREPTDIVIDWRDGTSQEDSWRGILGNGYAKSMRASPLVERLRHMKSELDRGEDTFERKLRYVFWLN